MIINLSGLTQEFSIDGKKVYTVTLYALTPLKLQSLTPSVILQSASRFQELEELDDRDDEQEKEYGKMLLDFTEATAFMALAKLKSMVKGSDAEGLLSAIAEVEQEEMLLEHIERVLKEHEETKKK